MANNKFEFSVLFSVLNKATAPLKKIGGSFSQLGKQTKTLGDKFKKLKSRAMESLSPIVLKLKSMGSMMGSAVKRIGIGLAGFAMGAFKASKDFNALMANVASLIPGNLKRIGELKKGVQSMSIEMGKSTSDLAEGLYQVVSAYGDSEIAIDQLRITAMAGQAGLATTTEALNLLSSVTKGYGDTSKEAMTKAADLAFTTVKLGQTTFPELASSMGRVIPLAAQLGVKQEELFSGFATLTGITGNASEVSTQFAAIMRAMLKPTEDMKKAAKSLGFESASTMLKEKGLVNTLTELMKYTKGNEEATAGLFGRAEALTAVFALSGKQLGDYNKKLKEHNRSAGAMGRAQKEQTRGISKAGFAWEQMKTTLAVMFQNIGDKLSPAFEKLSLAIIKMLKPGTPFMKAIDKVIWFTEKLINLIEGLARFLSVRPGLSKYERTAGLGEEALSENKIISKEARKKLVESGTYDDFLRMQNIGKRLGVIKEKEKMQVDLNLKLFDSESGVSAGVKDTPKVKGHKSKIKVRSTTGRHNIFIPPITEAR